MDHRAEALLKIADALANTNPRESMEILEEAEMIIEELEKEK